MLENTTTSHRLEREEVQEMPKMSLDDVVAAAWETLQPQSLEESEKSLEFLEKLLTNNK